MVLTIQNDGSAPDSFTVAESGSYVPYFSIGYYHSWGSDEEITDAVVAGTYTTPVLAPGSIFRIRVWVRIGGFVPSSPIRRLVTVHSVANPSLVDAVGFTAWPPMSTSATRFSQSGTVGSYSLNDTTASPGSDAIYRYEGSYDAWRLRQIVVHAPNVRAVSGNSAQKVGWSFTIQRRFCSWGHCSSWYDRYTSAKFTATTSDATNAPFSDEHVGVRLPKMMYDAGYQYRAIVKMFWYRHEREPPGDRDGTRELLQADHGFDDADEREILLVIQLTLV